jgi:hypothetical protein
MPHLPIERFAVLADDTPSSAERSHLAECAACRHELEAHARLRALAASEWARIAPPLTTWDAIADRLRGEGLVATPARRRRALLAAAHWGMRAAAAALLVAGGVAAGRWSAGASPLPVVVSVAPPGAGTPAPGAPDSGASVTDGSDDEAGLGRAGAGAVTFASSEDALVALADAERQYQSAVAFLVQQDSSAGLVESGPAAYRTRLAALDEVTAAAREALYEAPHDPLINRYYLATVGAREATLRQLNTALPVGSEINRF